MISEERVLPEDFLSGNIIIADAIARFHLEESRDRMSDVLDSFWQRMGENGYIMIPVLDPKPESGSSDSDCIGTVFDCYGNTFIPHHVSTTDGRKWLAAFTSDEEYRKGEHVMVLIHSIYGLLDNCRDMAEDGIIINPWGQYFLLTKKMINGIFDEIEKTENQSRPSP